MCDIFISLESMRNTILNRKFKYTDSNVTTILIVINFVVFALTYFLFPRLKIYLGMVPSLVYYKHYYWQFFTYMFTHANITHLIFNMLSLYIFGRAVEHRVGSREFLLYYLLVGTLSGIASYCMYYLTGTNVILVGASGAIYGLLILFAVLYPYAVILVFGIIPVKAPLLVAIYFFISLFSGFSASSTAHLTHLFGLVFGFLYILIRLKINPFSVWSGRS